MRTLVQLIIRLRWPLLVLLTLMTAAAAVVVVRGLEFDFSPRALFLNHDAELAYIEEFRERFGAEDATFLVVLYAEDDGLWTPEGLELLSALTDRVGQVEHIASSQSLTSVSLPLREDGGVNQRLLIEDIPSEPAEMQAIRTLALDSPLLAGQLVSRSGDTAVVVARFEEGFEGEMLRRPAIDEVDAIVQELVSEPFQCHAIGLPQVQREYALILPRDLMRNSALAVVLISIFLWVLFRNFSAIVVPNIAVGMALVWTLAAMVLAGQPVDMVNSVITSLVLVIGVSEAVHLIARYRELLAEGRPPKEALQQGISRVALACLLTATTSAVGFASLCTASISVVRVLGVFAASGIMFAFVTAIILVPACYSFLPPPTPKKGAAGRGASGRWTDWVGRYVTSDRGRRVTWIVSLIVTGVAIVGITRLDANNYLLEEMWPSNRVSVSNRFVEEHFGGVLPVEIEISVPEGHSVLEPEILQGIHALQTFMEEDPYVGRGLSLADLVIEAHLLATGDRELPTKQAQAVQELFFFEMGDEDNLVEQYTDVDRRHARLSTFALDWGSDHFFDWLDELEALSEESFPEWAEVHPTGAIFIANRALDNIVSDTFRSLATAFVIICILMILLFRSIRVGMLSMIPNMLPLIITLGVMGFMGITIRTSMVLVFALSLGVAVDDTIHIFARYRQELEVDGDIQAALRRAVSTTGQALVYASTLLVAGFGIFLTSSFYGLFQFGFLGAVTLTTALLADLFLTPAMIQTFKLRVKGVGERNSDSSPPMH